MQMNLPRDVLFILKTIREGGHEAFAVGGCVRDSLMGNAPQDWDITTSMPPLEIKEKFRRTFDTGLKHGTVTVALNRANYEVTTFRRDGAYRDGRRPDTVEFTTNIEDDLSRRDFTINAMAYNDERGLIDLFGGARDLENKLIRAVGLPEKRFNEDALRMLRAVRFAAQLGFEIEAGTLRAIGELSPRLELISAERVREELLKLLLSPNPQKGALLESTGMMKYVLRGREYGGSRGWDLNTALERIARCPKNPAMVMALFLSWAGDECENILRDLRFDNKTAREASEYVKRLFKYVPPERYKIKKILAAMPKDWFFNLLTLRGIVNGTAREEAATAREIANDIFAKGECFSLDSLNINGNDLITAGIPKGKPVGDTLLYLLDEVHKRPEINERDELLKLALNCY